MTKIMLDFGHGPNTPGKRTPAIPELGGRVIKEHEFNLAVVLLLDKELKRNGFETVFAANPKEDTPLKDRTDLANKLKVDLYISIHYNALDGKFDGPSKDPEGFSAHIYKGQTNKESGKFAKIALKYLSEGTKQVNRGLVEQDLHVVRETNMPSVLFELGFMDNKFEAMLMANPNFIKECAIELSKAVCEFYGVEYKTEVIIKPAADVKKEVEVDEKLNLTKWQKEELAEIYRLAKEAGLFSSDAHADKVLNGELTVSEGIYLATALFGRYLKEVKKNG